MEDPSATEPGTVARLKIERHSYECRSINKNTAFVTEKTKNRSPTINHRPHNHFADTKSPPD
jgi:hypothetical protein